MKKSQKTKLGICCIVVILVLIAVTIPVNTIAEPGEKGSYFVWMENNAAKALVNAYVKSKGAFVKYEYTIVPKLINIRNFPSEALAGLERIPGVMRIQKDREATLHLTEGPYLVRADYVWNEGITGQGVNVCVVDTGVDDNHPDIHVAYEYDFYNNDKDAMDDNGHGTHVAGIVSSQDSSYSGNSYQANIFAAKTINENGGGYESDTVAGIQWCVARDADVITISLGFSNHEKVCDGQPAAEAANAAVDDGVVVVASTGNDGSDIFIANPACGSKVIAVGATDKDNVRTSYSNGNQLIDVVAPGGEWGEGPKPDYQYSEIVSLFSPNVDDNDNFCFLKNFPFCYDNYYRVETDLIRCVGTSMSTPAVAGVAAQLLQENPDLTPAEIRQILRKTAVDLGPEGFDVGYGFGLVDAYEAWKSVSACSSNEQCDDGNECTDNICNAGVCENPPYMDGTSCSGGVCCGGTCSAPVCSTNGDCDDSESCTTDTCINGGTCVVSCENTWPVCGNSDGCCGPECTSIIGSPDYDIDCPSSYCGDGTCAGSENGEDCSLCPEDCISGIGGNCDYCWKGKCDGTCNPAKEDSSCADCNPGSCCGNGTCEGEESVGNCAVDCGCNSDIECDDNKGCTTDTCISDTHVCENTWPACGISEGCCGPNCTPENDPDCTSPINECIPSITCNCNGKCQGKETNANCQWDCP